MNNQELKPELVPTEIEAYHAVLCPYCRYNLFRVNSRKSDTQIICNKCFRLVGTESAAPIAPAAEDEFITIRKSTLRRLREMIQAEIRIIDDTLLKTLAEKYQKLKEKK